MYLKVQFNVNHQVTYLLSLPATTTYYHHYHYFCWSFFLLHVPHFSTTIQNKFATLWYLGHITKCIIIICTKIKCSHKWPWPKHVCLFLKMREQKSSTTAEAAQEEGIKLSSWWWWSLLIWTLTICFCTLHGGTAFWWHMIILKGNDWNSAHTYKHNMSLVLVLKKGAMNHESITSQFNTLIIDNFLQQCSLLRNGVYLALFPMLNH